MTEFHIHEALHTASILVDMVDRHLAEHPAIVANAEWKLAAEDIAARLAGLYQRIGAASIT